MTQKRWITRQTSWKASTSSVIKILATLQTELNRIRKWENSWNNFTKKKLTICGFSLPVAEGASISHSDLFANNLIKNSEGGGGWGKTNKSANFNNHHHIGSVPGVLVIQIKLRLGCYYKQYFKAFNMSLLQICKKSPPRVGLDRNQTNPGDLPVLYIIHITA